MALLNVVNLRNAGRRSIFNPENPDSDKKRGGER
jgi:hypothetical protein